jgi:hypothetical protein
MFVSDAGDSYAVWARETGLRLMREPQTFLEGLELLSDGGMTYDEESAQSVAGILQHLVRARLFALASNTIPSNLRAEATVVRAVLVGMKVAPSDHARVIILEALLKLKCMAPDMVQLRSGQLVPGRPADFMSWLVDELVSQHEDSARLPHR